MKTKSASVSQAKQIIDNKQARLVDVRTPVEFEEKHIAGSELLTVTDLEDADRSAPLLLICLGGTRAQKAADQLAAKGFENLTVLEGGVTAWENAGHELTRGERKVLPLIRQVHLTIGLLALTGSILALTVDVRFALLPAFLGTGLTLAGATGWCGLALLLSKMPWNQSTKSPGASCSVS